MKHLFYLSLFTLNVCGLFVKQQCGVVEKQDGEISMWDCCVLGFWTQCSTGDLQFLIKFKQDKNNFTDPSPSKFTICRSSNLKTIVAAVRNRVMKKAADKCRLELE